MLTQTFVHLPGVGPQTERRLWAEGCSDWDAALADSRYSFGSAAKAMIRSELQNSKDALAIGNHQYFASCLKAKDVWRAYGEFQHSCVYLDIETDGGMGEDCVTVIGCYDGSTFRAFVQGEDLESFRDYISNYSLVVTFFGGGFDLPVLQRRFPAVMMDQIHIDLCPLLRTLGFRGGLKRIEKTFGIERAPQIDGLNGWDAVQLWRLARRGDDSAMDTLIAYNRADVVNLKPLAEHGYRLLREQALAAPFEAKKPRKRQPWWVDERSVVQ